MPTMQEKDRWLTHGHGRTLTEAYRDECATRRGAAESSIGEAHLALQRMMPAFELAERTTAAAVVKAKEALEAAVAKNLQAQQATRTARADATREERRIRKHLMTELDEADVEHRRLLESAWMEHKCALRRGAAA